MTSPPRFVAHPSIDRCGYTLIELTIAMSLSTVLVVGLSSALLISAEAFRGNHGAQKRATAAQVQADMLSDLQHATSFTTKTATSIAFKVPDRNGDSTEDSIAYAWDSGAKSLTYTYNGSSAQTLVTDMTAFNIDFLTRAYSGTYSSLPSLAPNLWGTRFGGEVIFEELTRLPTPSKKKFIYIPTPSGTVDGDLLVAAVALDGNEVAGLQAVGMSGWSLLAVDCAYTKVTLGVWWKIASSEPSTQLCDWGRDQEAYGWIMRFTGHDPGNPINAFAVRLTDENITFTPTSPAVTTTVDDALILRLGAFDEDDYSVVDQPGLSGHIAITMDENIGGQVTGGAGYKIQAATGNSGTSTFSLTDDEETVTITIAIAPN